MKELARKFHWVLSTQFGIDLRRMVYSFRGIPRYIAGWFRFRIGYKGKINFFPCLYDWFEEGGSTKSEYFFQDLYVAQKINRANPEIHVDVGSRIDGFVAHVASFREIEIFDIRPVTSSIGGVLFRQADLMSHTPSALRDYCDSLSCLHALEHFGLGRYGDPVDPHGYVAGLANISKILRPDGLLYLSVPIGKERVEFNAHRVFDPSSLVQLASENELLLREFVWIGPDLLLNHSSSPEQDMIELGKLRYALGIFTFVKQ